MAQKKQSKAKAEMQEQLVNGIAAVAPCTIDVTAEGLQYPIKVRPTLTLEQRSFLVESIADLCFVGDEYVPYMADFARKYGVLSSYTDLNFDNVSMEEAYRMTQNRELYRAVYDVIDDDLSAVFADVNMLIDWRKQKLLKTSKAEELYDALINFVDGLETMLDRIAEMLSASEAENGVSMKDMVAMIDNLKHLDEAKLAQAVLAAQQKPKAKRATQKAGADISVAKKKG